MYSYDIIYLSRLRHEELMGEADRWSGRAYGFYADLADHDQSAENRIVTAIKALFVRQPAQKPASTLKPASGARSLSAATK
ncbi:MAG: hypothetical protein HC853_19570 [Anaerolineae bacterium]|nr:hypothetical protein [Anaerolineae bacterium]